MLEYRIDFIIGALSTILEQGVGIAFIWIIFENIESINGWSFYEIVFVYGMLTMSMAMEHIFFDNLWMLGDAYIRNGKFDGLLVRPVHPLFHVIADKIQQDGVGRLIIGIYLVIYALMKLEIEMNFMGVCMLFIFVLSGACIFIGISIALSSTAFYFINNVAIMWGIFQFNEFAAYPIDIFNKYIRFFITWIIPYAFASYYPASYFLDKGYKNLSYLSPIMAIFILYVGIKIWNRALRKYNSAGG